MRIDFLKIIFILLLSQSYTSLDAVAQITINSSFDDVFTTNRVLTNESFGFLENKGQMVDVTNKLTPFVLFKVESPGLNIWITTTGLSYQHFVIDKEPTSKKKALSIHKNSPETEKIIRWNRFDMILKNATIKKENVLVENIHSIESKDFYYAHCPNGIRDVKTFSKITITEIYPNIDWVLYTSGGNLKQDFIVHPGADPSQITLHYEGRGDMRVGAQNIQINSNLGSLSEGKLECFQENEIITASYVSVSKQYLTLLGVGIDLETPKISTDKNLFSQTVKIELGEYDKTQDLVIDPRLIWGTLYGGNSVDGCMSMAIDSDDNLFLTGYTYSTNFPLLNSGSFFQGSQIGTNSMFIQKFDVSGVQIWSSYYGGTQATEPYSLAIDFAGNVFVTGANSSADFPTQDAGTFFQGTIGGAYDAFLLKFDNDGNRIWATFFGGSGQDLAHAITTDLDGNILITGYTDGMDFPILDAGTFFQETTSAYITMFISKFDNDGILLWSSLHGGSNHDSGFAITTDSNKNIFVTGRTRSTDFPLQNYGTYFQSAYAGTDFEDDAAFILKFDDVGNRLWSTYYGGNGDDNAMAIKADLNDDIYIVGRTTSSNLPCQDAGTFYQDMIQVGGDLFILKFDNLGNRLWATYYGANGSETVNSVDLIAIDDCNNVYIAFDTRSFTIPRMDPGNCSYFDGTGGSVTDVFLTKFDQDGTLEWATFIGANEYDFRSPVVVDSHNDVFLGGEFMDYTTTADLPMMPYGNAYFDNSPNGNDDSFILKFSDEIIALQSQTDALCSCNGSATIYIECGLPPYDVIWSNGDEVFQTNSAEHIISNLCAGVHSVTIYSQCNRSKTFNFIIEGEHCSGSVEAPNIFTPNNDNSNDLFELDLRAIISVELTILNRWGNIVYQASDSNPTWDGHNINGSPVSEGTYFYVYRAIATDGFIIDGRGFVQLIRE